MDGRDHGGDGLFLVACGDHDADPVIALDRADRRPREKGSWDDRRPRVFVDPFHGSFLVARRGYRRGIDVERRARDNGESSRAAEGRAL